MSPLLKCSGTVGPYTIKEIAAILPTVKKKKKDAAAVLLGRKGGRASAEKLTGEQRKEKARKAAQAKWAKNKAEHSLNWLTSTGLQRRQARKLTNREREVAEYAAQGRSNKYIADHLQIGLNTVKKHVSQALEKLGASNRTELAFQLANDHRDLGNRTPGLDNNLMSEVFLEAAKEAYEMAQYLVKRGRPISATERQSSTNSRGVEGNARE